MSDGSKCKKCQQVIHWHRSKAGKAYPCNSEDRRDFHKCSEAAASAQVQRNEVSATLQPPQQRVVKPPSPKPEPVRSIEQRIEWLGSEVRGLLIRMDGLGT